MQKREARFGADAAIGLPPPPFLILYPVTRCAVSHCAVHKSMQRGREGAKLSCMAELATFPPTYPRGRNSPNSCP